MAGRWVGGRRQIGCWWVDGWEVGGRWVGQHSELPLLQVTFKAWKVDPLIYYSFRDLGADLLIIRCVTELVESRAFAGANKFVATGEYHNGDMREVLEKLECFGLVALMGEQEGSSEWEVTKLGSVRLMALRRLHDPENAIQLRGQEHLPLSDSTSFELLAILDRNDWHWKKKPANRPANELAPYIYGESDKVFYTSGLGVNKLYVQCLLQSEQLASDHQVYAIEHGMQDIYS